MPSEAHTVAELEERLEKQDLVMLALETELDATREELLTALRALDRYRQWHIESLMNESEAED